MSEFSVNILGCGSATPSLRHNPSCQVVDFRGTLFMIDCGEGAQLQMRRMRMKFSNLRHIFISHLHGDHYLGLPGLLSTLSLHGTTGDVHVYAFAAGIEVLKQIMAVFQRESTIRIVYHEISPDGGEVLYEDDALTVESIALYHSVPCVGFVFREKPRLRPLRADMVEFFGVPVSMRHAIKQGADFVREDGTIVENERLTYDAPPSTAYAYCSDTRFDRRVADAIRGVENVYHESTYPDEKADKARERGHSTAAQAGRIAAMAGAKRLIIGHYSKSVLDDKALADEAAQYFPNVVAATETMKIDLHGK